MEDGLVQLLTLSQLILTRCLNPCCDGRWSRTPNKEDNCDINKLVLILVVMEDGLVLKSYCSH